MEILLCLIYVALCYLVFKLFKIPVNQWSLATATLGGIIGIFLLLLVMNYNHPYTKNARIYFAVTPVLPGVKGRVVEVPVQANKPLKQGDVLFKIDPAPYQYVVDQKKASLAEAEQSVKQLKAALDQASAAAERANAQFKLAQQDYDRQTELFEKKVVAQAALDTFTRNLETARQSLTGARAEEERARLAYTSDVGGVNTTVARLQAEAADAGYNLDQTVTRAPSDGFVTQVALRPGLYVVPVPLRPAMVFVNTSLADSELGAAFQQNALQRVRAGDEAEVAFDAVPGRVFKARVRVVVDAIAPGQLQATGTLVDAEKITDSGRAMAIIDLGEDMSGYQLPLGAAAQVAIYTEHWHHLSLLRKILLVRMRSWENSSFFSKGIDDRGLFSRIPCWNTARRRKRSTGYVGQFRPHAHSVENAQSCRHCRHRIFIAYGRNILAASAFHSGRSIGDWSVACDRFEDGRICPEFSPVRRRCVPVVHRRSALIRLGQEEEDRFFASVFFGSALLFLAMLFATGRGREVQ